MYISISMNYEDITWNQLQILLDFCFAQCDKLSLKTNEQNNMMSDDLNSIVEGFKESIMNQNKIYKKIYDENTNGFQDIIDRRLKSPIGNTREKAYELFDNMLKKELERLPVLEEYRSREKKRCSDITVPHYDFFGLPFLAVETTNTTPMTSGTTVDLCFFQCNEVMRQEIARQTGLFESINIAGIRFDDMAFYLKDRVFFSLCSHEQYAYFDFTEQEYEEFKKLELPYENPLERWWDAEYDNNYLKYDDKVPMVVMPSTIIGARDILCELTKSPNLIQDYYEEYAPKLKPNLRSFKEILEIIKNKYTVLEDDSKEAKDFVRATILINDCLVKKLPPSHDTEIIILLLQKEGKALPLYENQIKEHEELMKEKTRDSLFFEEYPYEEVPIIVGGESHSGYLFVDGSKLLADEVTILRGLDEKELKIPYVVANYMVKVKQSSS